MFPHLPNFICSWLTFCYICYMGFTTKDTTHIRISKKTLSIIDKICDSTGQSKIGWIEIAAKEKIERDNPDLMPKKRAVPAKNK